MNPVQTTTSVLAASSLFFLTNFISSTLNTPLLIIGFFSMAIIAAMVVFIANDEQLRLKDILFKTIFFVPFFNIFFAIMAFIYITLLYFKTKKEFVTQNI